MFYVKLKDAMKTFGYNTYHFPSDNYWSLALLSLSSDFPTYCLGLLCGALKK
jgi:hypothetical protein